MLADKLCDLALLYEEYEKAVEGKYLDENNYLAQLPALAEKGVRGADVYVAAYASFHPSGGGRFGNLLPRPPVRLPLFSSPAIILTHIRGRRRKRF